MHELESDVEITVPQALAAVGAALLMTGVTVLMFIFIQPAPLLQASPKKKMVETQMPISLNLRYADRLGNFWRVIEKRPFGRAILARVDCHRTAKLRYIDIRADFKLA